MAVVVVYRRQEPIQDMDRFSAYLLVRHHLKRAESRNRALAVEAIMEELARHAQEPEERWGVMGLLSQLDLEYAAENPGARGRTARAQAELEGGLSATEALSLEAWCRPPAESSGASPGGGASPGDPLFAALLLADTLAECMLSRDRGALLEQTAPSLAHDIDLRRQQGDALGDALDRALDQLSLEATPAAEIALAAARRIAGELR